MASADPTNPPITVRSIRRYPVKSMGGEDLEAVDVDTRGIVGDRWFAVRDADGHLASGKNTRRFRRRDAVFEYAARTTLDGVRVGRGDSSWPVGDPALNADLCDQMNADVAVLPETDIPHYDDKAVSFIGSATLAWMGERWQIDADPRRLRVNFVFATDEPFIEESWTGLDLTLGTATLRVIKRVERCRMIDIAQDGVLPQGRWLVGLGRERQTSAAMYADVLRPGSVQVGDTVRVDA